MEITFEKGFKIQQMEDGGNYFQILDNNTIKRKI